MEISLLPLPADHAAQTRGEDIADPDVIVRAETERCLEIARLCTSSGLGDELARSLIASRVSLDHARAAMIDRVAERAGPDVKRELRLEMGGQNDMKTRQNAITNAILNRIDASIPLTESGREYRGLTLLDCAKECLEGNGTRTRRLDATEIVQRSFHATSDFPLILANIANLTLIQNYQKLVAQQTFRPLIKIADVRDFKEVSRVRLSEVPSLAYIPEGGELKMASFSEAGESYKIASYARGFQITRQALINDSLDAFKQMTQWGAAATRLESRLVWDVLLKNDKMGDGKSLFHKDHGNIAAQGKELSAEALTEAKLAFALQKTMSGDDYIRVTPRYLIVPVEMEVKAWQMVNAPISPTNTAESNPFFQKFTVISEPLLTGNPAWYLATSPDEIDMIELAYLNGQRAPTVESAYDFDTSAYKVKAMLDVGVKALDWKGFYRNGGKSA